ASRAVDASDEGAGANAGGRQWIRVPRVWGRITAEELGVVINVDDPYSVEVGEHYIRARKISPSQVLRLRLPVRPTLDRQEFQAFRRQVDGFFGVRSQGLALAWRQPHAVECHSITGALALGFDPALCEKTCAPSKPSRYFGSSSTHPMRDFGVRLSMLLAAPDVAQAKALINRGVASDGTLGERGAQPANVHFVATSDALRSVRRQLFPPAGPVPAFGIDVHLDQTDALRHADRVLMYLTGRTHVDGLESVNFLPGALADHLTSFGGVLDKPNSQMTVMSWIQAGATASHGTVSEPCSHLQKFPHPQLLLLFYAQGASAMEAYWKSVAWPRQSLFVGEPLAAPFGR
ncbi:TIGR03790 family protein, partial [Aquabacterium sp. UBA2148]|uniref:TIGR03790 family protein n=1 Tax=Aquabacterium sp. UBA2148 TaxID=1946042 RepID=UPI0032E387BF